MWQLHGRTRAVVERELTDATRHRADAVHHLDLDAYQHLTEHIDDLLLELHGFLPAQRVDEP